MRSESSWAGAKRHGEQPARVTVRHKSAERRQEVLRRTRGVASARCRPAVLHPGESLRSCPRLLLSREKISQSLGLLLVAKTGGRSRHLGGGSQEMLLNILQRTGRLHTKNVNSTEGGKTPLERKWRTDTVMHHAARACCSHATDEDGVLGS